MQQVTFEQYRATYLDTLDKAKGISEDYKNLLTKKVMALEDRNYYVIGYGSLLNENDVYRTSPNLISHEVDYISGWKRVFNMGNTSTGAYLNVKRDDDVEDMIVAVLTVPAKDMINVIEREINYDFVNVRTKSGKTAMMVVGTNTKHNLIPQANYLHLCMHGVGKLAGQAGIDNFVETTETCYGPLSEFLNMSLNTIYRTQEYSPR